MFKNMVSPSVAERVRRFLILGFFVLILGSTARADPNILFATGCGAFGETGLPPLWLGEPDIEVRNDGSVIVDRDDERWIGRIEKQRFEQLAEYLASHELLKETRVLENVHHERGFFWYHGGMCYLAHGSEPQVVAAFTKPDRGEWRRVLRKVENALPRTWSRWEPASDVDHENYMAELRRILDNMAWQRAETENGG